MAERYARGEPLFHPLDARLPLGGVPLPEEDDILIPRSSTDTNPAILEANYRTYIETLDRRLHEHADNGSGTEHTGLAEVAI